MRKPSISWDSSGKIDENWRSNGKVIYILRFLMGTSFIIFLNGDLSGKTIYTWWDFPLLHCHIWLPEGNPIPRSEDKASPVSPHWLRTATPRILDRIAEPAETGQRGWHHGVPGVPEKMVNCSSLKFLKASTLLEVPILDLTIPIKMLSIIIV